MIKQSIIVAIIILIAVPAIAIDLYCDGISYDYANNDRNSYKSGRLVSLNKKTKKATIDAIEGGKLTVEYYEDETIFILKLPINKIIKGKQIIFENVNINRYTGEMTGVYTPRELSMLLTSFDGICREAKKAF